MSTEKLASDRTTSETITHVHRWTERLLSFRTTRPDGYQFKPGQYARLGLDAESGALWRAYSIVSAPSDDHLEYYGVIVPGGEFTGLLKDLGVGDHVKVEKQSYGFMTPDRFEDGDALWMLATGTGLGPFISILRDPAVWTQFRNLIVVHCVRHADELSYTDELLAWQDQAPFGGDEAGRLHVIQSVTQDKEKLGGGNAHAIPLLHERITALLQNGGLEKAAGLPITPESSRVMLCGNPAMIEDTRRMLHERGMRPCRRATPGQFLTENYW